MEQLELDFEGVAENATNVASKATERKLATIRRIAAINPIPKADAIEVATVDGWQVVVKKGDFKVDDLVIYLEIDSWVPTEVAPFLSKGKEPREFNGVKGERLRTIKLRGQLSQGLILPISVVAKETVLDDDVTEILNIQKWERPIHPSLQGQVRGNFPSAVPKTDQQRIQNLTRNFETSMKEESYEVTEKLDGTSCTFYLDMEGTFHVCSRNLDLKETEGNLYWSIARKNQVEEKMRHADMLGIAIQGEIVGPSIQGNSYELQEPTFFVFEIIDVMIPAPDSKRAPAHYRHKLTTALGLNHVPFAGFFKLNETATIESLLTDADGPSALNPNAKREGLVFKSQENPDISFKVISNEWLLNGGE